MLKMESPSREMYNATSISRDRILIIGCSFPLDWGITINPDPTAGAMLQWSIKEASERFKPCWDLIVLDWVTNSIPPPNLPSFWKSLKSLRTWTTRVEGRCIVSNRIRSLRGPTLRWSHSSAPENVNWIEIWNC